MRSKALAEAVAVFDGILERRPRDREARRLRGLALLELGHAARAAADLEALRPLDTGTARYLGAAFLLSGRPALAVEVLREVCARDPDREASLFLARALRSTGANADAEALLRALAADPAAPPGALADLADMALDPKDPSRYRPADAVRHAEAARERGAPCYDVLARAYAAAGEPELALLTAEVGLEDAATGAAARDRCRAFLAAAGPGAGRQQ